MVFLSPSQSCGVLDSYDEETRRVAGWVQKISSKGCPVVIIVRDRKIINACFASIPVNNEIETKRFCFDEVEIDVVVFVVENKAVYVLDAIEGVNLGFDAFDAVKYREKSHKLRKFLIGKDFADFKNVASIALSNSFLAQYVESIVKIGLRQVQSKELVRLMAAQTKSLDPRDLILKDFNFRDGSDSESKFAMEVGSVSSDESSVIGRDGHIFIFRGSNRLYEQYFADKEWASDCASKRINLFEQRKRSSEKFGAEFFQFVIPEKSSIAPESFPKAITPPMPLVKELNKLILERKYGENFVVLQEFMERSAERTSFYRKIDCHLNFLGCQKTFIEILRVIGFPDHSELALDEPVVLRGDVGSRFPGVVEFLKAPNQKQAADLERGLSLVDKHNPASGIRGHRRVFQHSNARYRKKVVAFANSFFALGEAAHELTWWFARNFSEFHLVWMSEFEEEYIEKVKPDIVLAQTIERFLGVIPER